MEMKKWAAAIALALATPSASGVKFVGVLPLSGKDMIIGRSFSRGYSIAFQEFEENGGLIWRGEKQELDFEEAIEIIDDSSSTTIGPALLDEYLTSNVTWTNEDPVVVLGGFGSSSIVGQLRVTNKHNVLMVNGGGADGEMYRPESEGGQNTNRMGFGLLSPVSKMASTTMLYLMDRMDLHELPKPCTVALIWEDSSHGQAYREVVTQFSLQYPEYFRMAYAADFPYPTSVEDSVGKFGNLSSNLYKENKLREDSGLSSIDTLLVDAHSDDFVRLQNELSKFDFKFKFVTFGARGTDSQDIVNLRSPQSANHFISAQWWSVSLNKPRSRAFVRKWRLFEAFDWAMDESDGSVNELFSAASEQLQVSWFGALGYQAALILLEALNSTTEQTQVGVRDYMLSTTFTNTILPGGIVEFDTYGQATNDYTIVQSSISNSTNMVTINTLYPKSQQSGQFEAISSWNADFSKCGPSFIGYSVSSCQESDAKSVTFFWKDQYGYPCNPPDKPCACTPNENFLLPSDFKEDCEFVSVGSRNGKAIIAFASIGAIICFASLLFLLWHYNHVVMKAGQREFLALMCFAGVWCNVAALAFLGPNEDHMCITRVLYLLMSITLLIGSLTVKVYRIYKIWNNSSMKRIVITAYDMFKVLLVLMFGMVIIFTVWMIIQTPHQTISFEEIMIGGKTLSIKHVTCNYFDDVVLPVVAISYIFLILLYCNVLSCQGRNSASQYMESRSIMFASYCMTIILLLVILLFAAVDLGSTSQILLIALSLVFTSLLFVGLVLGPKIYFATRPSIKDVKSRIKKRLISGKNSSFGTSDVSRPSNSMFRRGSTNPTFTNNSDDGEGPQKRVRTREADENHASLQEFATNDPVHQSEVSLA